MALITHMHIREDSYADGDYSLSDGSVSYTSWKLGPNNSVWERYWLVLISTSCLKLSR